LRFAGTILRQQLLEDASSELVQILRKIERQCFLARFIFKSAVTTATSKLGARVKGEIGHRATGLAPQPTEEIEGQEHITHVGGPRCLKELEVYVPQQLLDDRKLPAKLRQGQAVALGLEVSSSLGA
jgi:hypothetical protein